MANEPINKINTSRTIGKTHRWRWKNATYRHRAARAYSHRMIEPGRRAQTESSRRWDSSLGPWGRPGLQGATLCWCTSHVPMSRVAELETCCCPLFRLLWFWWLSEQTLASCPTECTATCTSEPVARLKIIIPESIEEITLWNVAQKYLIRSNFTLK